MTTTECYVFYSGSSKRHGFGGEVADGERSVAVRDLIKTFFLFGATAGRIEAAAKGRSAGDTEEGGGFGGIEDGIGLGVAFTAGGTLNPDNIASGVEDHV